MAAAAVAVVDLAVEALAVETLVATALAAEADRAVQNPVVKVVLTAQARVMAAAAHPANPSR